MVLIKTDEDKFVYGFLVVFLLGLIMLVSKFKHIPGPLFGGDLYMIRGFTQAILQGNAPWLDSYFAGHYAYYGWLSYWVTAFLVKITGMSLEKMSYILPAFIQILIMYAGYLFGSKFFKDKKYGIIFMLSLLSLRVIDIKISGAFASLFMLLSLWSWIELERGNKKHKYLLGLFLGLTALSHILSFISVAGLIGCAVLFESIRTKKIPVKKYLIPVVIAALISLILIGPWVFVYHMNTLNPSQQYSHADVTTQGIGWIVSIVWKFFIRIHQLFTLKGLLKLVSGLLALAGFVFAFLNKKKFEQRAAFYWLIGAVLLTSHFLITKPLLNNWIAPGLLWGTINWIVFLVLLTYGIRNIELILKNERVFLVVAGLLFVGFMFQSYVNFNNDQWVQYGRQTDQSLQIMFDTETWILDNTNKDDVFLGNDESSFALNALTGRNLVIARRTHANYYVDVDKRYADAFVMLYGNDRAKTEELLREYSVDYFYLDAYLMQRPMLTRFEFKDYLSRYGVNYSVSKERFDPAVADAPTYDALVVPPQEISLIEFNLTEPKKQFLIGPDTYSVIYQVKT